MANPLIVGTTAIVAVPRNNQRVNVRFQNTGATILYLAKAPIIPSSVSYEIMLALPTAAEINEAFITTNSTAQFNVVSSANNGVLAIFETKLV